MGLTVGLLVLLILGASWVCDARELTSSSLSSMIYDVSALQINYLEFEGKIKASEDGENKDVCTTCQELAAEAIKYLMENKTQIEIVDILHETCSRLVPLEQQCITMVDYYVSFLLQEIGSVQPGEFCQTVDLCEQRVVTYLPLSEDKCEMCKLVVEEVLLKLKDPDAQLDILELLLKACDAVESYLKKCKTMVLEYGPLFFSNVEEFLETVDICAVIHACDLPYAGSKQATPIDYQNLLSSAM